MKFHPIPLLATLATLFLAPTLHAQSEPSRTPGQSPGEPSRVIVVLDASGSMWGQIQGRAKIEIAREVTRDFVSALPEQVELGLVTYGHRRKGDCADIEMLIPPGKIDREAFISTVEGIQPKGMTPLTDAVEFAAEQLRYTEQKASVILVTDGEETCDRDPCEAAARMEELGVDFTAHVVAFDLDDEQARSVECLAANTGGHFLKADDAVTLADALEIAIEAETMPEPKEEMLGEATLEVPETAVAGSAFPVTWTGPDNRGDFITIVPEGTEDGQYDNYTYTRQGSPLELTALIEPGQAEVRYMTAKSRKVLARAPITLTEATVTLEAPETVVAGAEVPIEWTGPDNKRDFITIVPADTEDGKYAKYKYTNSGTPLKVLAPLQTGKAEIRYLSGQGYKTLARREIEITEATVTLEAPETVVAGADVPIEWTGPDNKRDFITIVPADTEDGKYAKYKYTSTGTPLKVLAPLQTGKAEIRYLSGQGYKTLARREIEITEATVTLEAPETAVAGSEVPIEWTGPDNKRDFITVVPADTEDGKYAKYAYTSTGTPLKVLAPLETGEAEIRYMSGQGNKVLARRPITLTEAKITLEAPETVVVGSEVPVEWTGPDNKRDFITIVPADTEDGKYAKYKYTSQGSPIKIEAPKESGEAEIRYMSGQGNKVMHRRAIRLTPAP